MQAKAVAKYVRVSPRKARIVVDKIRGKEVVDALDILRFNERAISEVVSKVVSSAAANAENKYGVRPENLVVKAAYVDEGPTMKRYRPARKGFREPYHEAHEPYHHHRSYARGGVRVMGQKVKPTGFRLGITEDWRSRWYAGNDYAATLENDLKLRKYVEKKLSNAALSRVEIERAGDKIKVIITTARPGIVIGKKGAEVDVLRKELEKISGGSRKRRGHRGQASRA